MSQNSLARARTTVRKTLMGSGIMEDISVHQAVSEAMRAGWSEFAARDYLRMGESIRTPEAIYHIN